MHTISTNTPTEFAVYEWESLIKSVQGRRHRDSRYFKPVCLIAIIDLVLLKEINPASIDPAAVFKRFHSYVSPEFPGKAELGWRPFWHLSNDGAWVFSKRGRVVEPSDFGPSRKPDSQARLLSAIDAVAVRSPAQWGSVTALLGLREHVLQMMEVDDETCRVMARAMRSRSPISPPSQMPLLQRQIINHGQGFQTSTEVKSAIEQRAMAIAIEMLIQEGYAVEDVSGHKCFDLQCTNSTGTKYVEVKGLTGDATEIILTRAEVEFANENVDAMILVVVSRIELQRNENEVVASGGIVTVLRQWRPTAERLRVISYKYSL